MRCELKQTTKKNMPKQQNQYMHAAQMQTVTHRCVCIFCPFCSINSIGICCYFRYRCRCRPHRGRFSLEHSRELLEIAIEADLFLFYYCFFLFI